MNVSCDCPWLIRRTRHRHHHQQQSIIIIIILVVAIIARRWPGPIRTPSTREEIPNGTRSSHPLWPQITSQTASFYAYGPHRSSCLLRLLHFQRIRRFAFRSVSFVHPGRVCIDCSSIPLLNRAFRQFILLSGNGNYEIIPFENSTLIKPKRLHKTRSNKSR